MRRVGRFPSTTIGLHTQVVRGFLDDSLAIRADASRVDQNSVLHDQAGEVHGFRESLRPFSRHKYFSCCHGICALYAFVCSSAIGIMPKGLRENP